MDVLTPQGTTISLSGLSPILPLLFRVVISNAGCLNEAYHLTLGLLGQLLLRISPAEADAAVTEALSEKYELLAPANGAINEAEGWKTTQLLFSLGAVCLDRSELLTPLRNRFSLEIPNRNNSMWELGSFHD